MNVDVGGFLAPIKRRGHPYLWLKIALSQSEFDHCRSVFEGRAGTCVLIHLRDSRLKLYLHRNRHPTPFATTDLPVDKLWIGERSGVIMDKRPQLSAKNKTDLMPNNASCKRWDTPD